MIYLLTLQIEEGDDDQLISGESDTEESTRLAIDNRSSGEYNCECRAIIGYCIA